MPCVRVLARVGGVEPVDVGEQHQHIGTGHLGDAGGQPVVVAKADLGGGDGVVLVDDRNGTEGQQLGEGGARVQMPPALLGIVEGQQDLRNGDAVARQRLLIGMGQPDLPGGSRRLLFFEAQTAPGEAEMAAADRDRPGGDEDHLLTARAATRHVISKCRKPRAAELAALGDQQCRTDLDNQPPRARQSLGRCHSAAARDVDCRSFLGARRG